MKRLGNAASEYRFFAIFRLIHTFFHILAVRLTGPPNTQVAYLCAYPACYQRS